MTDTEELTACVKERAEWRAIKSRSLSMMITIYATKCGFMNHDFILTIQVKSQVYTLLDEEGPPDRWNRSDWDCLVFQLFITTNCAYKWNVLVWLIVCIFVLIVSVNDRRNH